MDHSPVPPSAPLLSAVPRWSHRDAVEGGNPFPTSDTRHACWEAATRRATEALARFDAEAEGRVQGAGPQTYPARVVALAEARFDTWARRGLCVVSSEGTLRDYLVWLARYRENWLAYVRETCPNVNVGDPLRRRLDERVTHWTTEAQQCCKAGTSTGDG
jgi:hypothetical protein